MLHSPSPWHTIAAPYWDDKPVAIVGNGKSLDGFDFKRLRDRFHVLAVKGQMFNIKFADAGFGIDTPRYREWAVMLQTVKYPIYWAVPDLKLFDDVKEHSEYMRFIRRIDLSDLTDQTNAICCGGTSGFGALNIAWHKKAKDWLLLGFDYDADQNGHYDPRAFLSRRVQVKNRWVSWSKNFDKIKRKLDVAGIRVINASPNSRIPTFEKMSIDDAIKELGGSQ